ncbi:MAG: L,D-transpeptidase family protein [Thermodesulfovibrionales bacterium]
MVSVMFRKALSFVACAILVINLCSQCLFPQGLFAVTNKADKVVVIKSKRILILLNDGEILKAYRIALGKNPEGRKIMAGDKRTPEGRYILVSKNSSSRFHLAIRISYPNESDLQNAQRLGVPPGGGIMIHGLPEDLAELGEFHRYEDWTDGCIAVTNSEMEEIWQMVDDGTPIEIKP